MLEDVALRLLGCDEYSRPKAITFALDTLTLIIHPGKHRTKKSIEEDLKNVIQVRRALMSIPTLKHCNIRSHATPQDVPAVYFPLNEDIERPHYQVGQHVWCQHGGWGFWPATVFAMEDTCLEILLCWGDMTQITYAETRTHVRPFMQHLAEFSVKSTNLQSGFHDGVEKTLAEIARSLPSYCTESFAFRPRERFAARMLRIASMFESYMNDLYKIPIFHNLQKEILRRHSRIAREIEEEEKRIVAEQRRKEKEERMAERAVLQRQREIENKLKREQREEERERRNAERQRMEEEKLQLKIYNAIHFPPGSTIFAVPEKMKHVPLKKNVIPLKHMIRNLQEQSHIPPDRKRKRAVVKNYNAIKVYETESCRGETSSHLKDRNKETSRKESDDDEECLTLLECVQMFHMGYALQQESKEDRGVQIYAPIYELLMNGTYADEESLVYCIKHRLPPKLIKMLLYKYFPFEVYKGKHGRTLLHLAAQHDVYSVIAMLHEHWANRFEAIHDHVINNVSNLAMLKDNHGRTAVHVACEHGSFKSLKVLQQLGCDLCERDKLGYTPLMWCASKDSPKCAFYLIDNGVDVTEEDRKGRSTLWHSMAGDSVLLGKTLFRNGCWMQGGGLQEFVADMSLGREPHKIMFDSRSLAECRAYYLHIEEEKGDECDAADSRLTISRRTRYQKNSGRTEAISVETEMDTEEDEEEKEKEEGHGGRVENRASNGSDRVGRSSSRVVQMSREVSDEVLTVESPKWSLSDHMADVCVNAPMQIPKFVYSTRSYLGEFQNDKAATNKAYECCDCEGDCTLNPDCACIMRNGQRSPYSSEGLFDFTKGKIFECGDKCSCKDSCKLRMTQRGVAYPLVVCRVGEKGHGVMSTKVILKGSFVCAYVGERVSEDDLLQQEEEKVLAMKKKSSFVTYAFEIHEGSETFNVDSEYVGNVARFFNHSCDPNLRPLKVVAASKQKWPTMCFFALRRIEAGEELTWKYVTGVRTKKGGQTCFCKSANCTGFV